jgi:hypothetical protein
LCCLESKRGGSHESECRLSSKPVHEETSKELLGKVVPGVAIYTEDQIGVTQEYDATVADLREMLRPLGLDVTTKDALDWGTKYPGVARDLNRICELQQELADLQHELGINPKSAVHRKLAE